jgi:hypothetical protein
MQEALPFVAQSFPDQPFDRSQAADDQGGIFLVP